MSGLRHGLQLAELAMFGILAVVAFVRWRRGRGVARAWVAATFCDLGVVVVAGYFLGSHPHGWWGQAAQRLLVTLLALFPLFLYRFARTFAPLPRWFDRLALALSAAAGLGVYVFPRLPATGEHWPAGYGVFVAVFLVEWALLNGTVAVRLWRAGAGEPTVRRRRCRTLATGSAGLALALILAGTAGGHANAEGVQVTIQLIALLAGPLFLIGFAPPAALLATWRRPEMDELRAAEAALVASMTPGEVGSELVGHVARIVGGRAAILVAEDGTILGADGIEPDDAERLARGELTARVEGESLIHIPLRSGRLIVVASTYTPYFGRQEAELIRDLTTLVDLALQRSQVSVHERRIATELAAANEAMREFVAIASHDLRTPIAVIKGYAALVDDEPDASRRTELTAGITRQADHLAVIVDDLLMTSRLDAGAVQAEPEVIDLQSVARELVADLGIEVTLDVPAGLRCCADPDHVRRMLTNYLQNARSYGSPPILLKGRRNGAGVELRVCDHGPGLPSEFAPRAFEKFARADVRTSKRHQGTGLGLSIVRGLARIDGGDAWYEPNSPVGACFALRLPDDQTTVR